MRKVEMGKATKGMIPKMPNSGKTATANPVMSPKSVGGSASRVIPSLANNAAQSGSPASGGKVVTKVPHPLSKHFDNHEKVCG
jgi:hypothetical protein